MAQTPPIELLKIFFSYEACQRATVPLKRGVEIAITVDANATATLVRTQTGLEVRAAEAQQPDMTFSISAEGLANLVSGPHDDIGEIGIHILKQMGHPDPKQRLHAKVHIGPVDLFWKGYLGVLPLGGPGVMKYLASRGVTGISKIKEGIARMRD